MTSEQKFDCVFCQETFDDKETLQIHFRKHGDPKFDLSTKIIKSRTQNETTPVEKVGEDIEMVGCDVCDEVFPTISKAITHKHKAHPDHEAKYFCPFCGKLFTMKHLLNKHMQSSHHSEKITLSIDFHCDMCEVAFNVPSAMLYHNKFFHRQDTEMPAIGHSKKIKLFSQEMVQIYYCSFCGEEYNNKVNLHKHITDDHSDENQSPSEVLRCPLCEAIFYHLDAYELHLTFHSSEDIYSEKNELVDQITEFSLETVAPIMENVEEEETPTQPESNLPMTNSDDIGNFLQLVMGDQDDNIAMEKVKHKKHKKHKKSKKASITLDEFLNMNKDVFGDGLGDVQGIEEVPTQVVLKKVKGKTQNKNEAKMVNADLAKLKKQGIIVKTKPKNTIVTNLKPLVFKQQQQTSGNKTDIKNKPNLLQKSSTDILSKLLNQGNSQIKVVKKSALQNEVHEEDDTKTLVSDAIEPSEQKSNFIPNNEFEKQENVDETLTNTEVSETVNSNLYSEMSNADGETKNQNEADNKLFVANSDFNGRDTIVDDKKPITQCSNISKVSNFKDSRISTIIKTERNISSDNFATFSQGKSFRSLDQMKHTALENSIDMKGPSQADAVKLNSQTHTDNCDNESETNLDNKTMSALKHLSHLITVKPLAIPNKETKLNVNEENNFEEECNSERCEESTTLKLEHKNLSEPLMPCGPIVVKSSKQSPSFILPAVQADTEIEQDLIDCQVNKTAVKLDLNTNVSQNVAKELKVKLVPLPQSTCSKFLLTNLSNKELNGAPEQQINEESDKTINCPKEQSNFDILKRLPNVTAKPVNSTKFTNQLGNAKLHQNAVTQVIGQLPKIISKGIDKQLEVYNIDDSDEDTQVDTVNNDVKVKQKCNVLANSLKILPRNITVKSNEIKINPLLKNSVLESTSTRSDLYSESYTRIKQSKEIQNSINLQNKLKNLGNITVKSRNSSPIYNKDQNKNYDDYDDEQATESGSDNDNIGGVKITEMNEDYMSENDFDDSHSNAVIQSPNVSNSDNEDTNEDLPDFENHIKTNTVKKNALPNSNKVMSQLDNFKNLNKTITIKPINTNTKNTEQMLSPVSHKDISEDPGNSNQEMALKPYKPNVIQNEQTLSKNIQASGSLNQSSVNQKASTSSNQVNTVKTVNTVKRFQSQTVIEEITTTVTKTIRTVNSSTDEVMQSTNQNTPKPVNRPQKIVTKQPGRVQGTAVRHASPTIGTKIRNAIPVARIPNAPLARPCNQLVPVRPVYNRPRCPIPSTSAVRKVTPPKCSPQKPAIGKLKISPHALNQTNKRLSDDTFGHFNSFKRPKDSLVSSPNLPDYSDEDTTVQYSSTSQSRSDFSTVSKNIKSKGMITATQSKSEVSTSSQQQFSKGMSTATQMRSEVCMSSRQQLSRLSNLSGLKVVKTSSKQTMQIEEKSELNPGKRNTLEAIEKLQKQGLLVKRPRLEEYDDQGNSFSESDDEIGDK